MRGYRPVDRVEGYERGAGRGGAGASVRYRLGAVGAAHALFHDDAIVELHACSRGSPREIDRIATMSLRDAARRKEKLVDKEVVAGAGQTLVRDE